MCERVDNTVYDRAVSVWIARQDGEMYDGPRDTADRVVEIVRQDGGGHDVPRHIADV